MTLISSVSAPSAAYPQEYLASQGQGETSAQTFSGSLSSSADASARAAEAYGGSGLASSIVQAAVQRAMEELQAQGKDRVTFDDIAQYQRQLEEEFSLRVRLELYDRGLPLETSFSLRLSSEGVVSVACDDAAARELITRYLSESSQTCEQFGYIQALTNLNRAARNPAALGVSLREARAELRASAVTAFTEAMSSGLTDYVSLLADFQSSSSGARFYTGISRTV
jgi:hypothetical protein